jgi:hypothetical protein
MRDPIKNTGEQDVDAGLITEAQIEQFMTDASDQDRCDREDGGVQSEQQTDRCTYHGTPHQLARGTTAIERPARDEHDESWARSTRDSSESSAKHDPGFFVKGKMWAARGGVFGATQLLVQNEHSGQTRKSPEMSN